MPKVTKPLQTLVESTVARGSKRPFFNFESGALNHSATLPLPSGTYFARIRVGGKLIRRSLESNVLSVAKLKLADLEKEKRTRLENHQQFGSGKATFSDLLEEYRTRLEANHSIKPRTRAYYNERIEAMLKNWPDLRQFDVRKLKPEDCERWAAK